MSVMGQVLFAAHLGVNGSAPAREEARFTSLCGFTNASFVIRCLGQKRWRRLRLTFLVHADEGHERIHASTSMVRDAVLYLDGDTDFHRRSKRRVDATLENDDIANANGRDEVHFIDRRRYRYAPRMTLRADGAAHINPREHRSPEGGPEHIGVLRQDKFRHLGDGHSRRTGRCAHAAVLTSKAGLDWPQSKTSGAA